MSRLSARRVGAIMRKEGRHILRDPQTLFIVLLMPVIMMFIYGYALTTDVREVRIAIEDPASSPESRAIIAELDASTFFRVSGVWTAINDPQEFFRTQRVKAIIRFPADFVRLLRSGRTQAPLQVLIDGCDANLGTILRNAAETALVKPVFNVLNREMPEPLRINQTVLYNPEQRSAFFFVPGLMVIILTMISALLTSIALTREKELGTLAQLLISPLRPTEVIIGKIMPYLALAAIDGALVLGIGRIAFGVKVAGSHLFLAGISVLYIFVCLSIGLLISAIATRQLHAMIAALVITLMPTVILTGFVFPVASMPVFLQILSSLLPASYFLQIVRGIMLKGVGPLELWQPMAVLCGMAIVLTAVSIKRFRMTL
jgi:ABC-2 type transport system permease protein